ncbi:LysR family transcriptional regulator [Peribacillus frigoritolerans]|uniref:LysR family transcriptional regulator n=1 Tax=Peribacillus frigoritolerans TaxID=450367 RepID=UPI0035177D60
MELLQLKYFLTIAQMGHLTRAAETLNISQPALSNSIARLEKDLGVPLFIKAGRRIKLSSFGQKYVVRVERILKELDDGQVELDEMIGIDTGRLSIAVTLPNIFPKILVEYLSEYPNVNVIQKLAYSSIDITRQLAQGEIDLCITTFPITQPNIKWIPLIDEPILITVPKSHSLANENSVQLKQFEDDKFIGITTDYGFRKLVDSFCLEVGFEPKYICQMEESSVIQELVEKEIGVTFTPLLLTKFKQFNSVSIPISEPTCQRVIGIAYHTEHFQTQVAKNFIHLVEHFFNRYKS